MNKKAFFKKLKRVLVVAMVIGAFSFGMKHMVEKAYAYTPKAGTVNGSGCRIRTAPESGRTIVQVNVGFPVTIIGESSPDGDGYIWYNIMFNLGDESSTGWMRSDLINTTITPSSTPSDGSFESQLTAQGFPESYKGYLRALHEIHPNWVFNSYNTGLSWSEAVAGELAVVDRNVVPKGSISSWKSLAAGAYDWDNDEWYEYERGWVAASKEYIEYCMDPRNFLADDDRILMFQNLGWNSSETIDGIREILASTVMQGDFPRYFYEAGQENGVSAYHLAARADQETNGGKSGSVTGTYKNYYNIGATGDNPVQAAVAYAQNKGWDTAEKSIHGGAAFIGGNYIAKGQSNLYLEKFDFVADGGYFWHQYMSNVLAPQHESSKLSKSAELIGRTQTVTFTIPIFSGMPETASPLPTADGNPNNYLDSITVLGQSLTPGFSRGVTVYDVIVPENTTYVTVGASPLVSSSSVTGTGVIALNSTTTTVKITCTPQYGSARTYTVNIVKSGTATGGGDSGGGSTTPATPTPATPALRKGDINGDDNRSASDLVYMKKYIVGLISLNADQLSAADLNGDGRVSAADLVLLKKHIVGLISLD